MRWAGDVKQAFVGNALEERVIRSLRVVSFGESELPGAHRLDAHAAWGDATFDVQRESLVATLTGPEQIYRLRIELGAPFRGNGVSVLLRTTGWRRLSTVLVGYTHAQMRRISIGNLWQERWVEVSFGQNDLSFLMQNAWTDPGVGDIAVLHLHFTGEPDDTGARLELKRIALFDEAQGDFPLTLAAGPATFRSQLEQPLLYQRFAPPPKDLLDTVYAHLSRQYHSAYAAAETFMALGRAPSYRASLEWALTEPLPPTVADVNSYRWSWHALQPVISLLIRARKDDDLAAVFAARDFASAWLDRSYYAVEADEKYAWYDHGVADRLLAFVLLWDFGVRLRFDQRFMGRMLEAIFRHAQLLASEMFYAHDQPVRYHNHAIFQDLALMATALCVPALGGARGWFEHAAARFSDQVQQLVVRQGDYAVCVENSPGYHRTFEDLVELGQKLITLAGLQSEVPGIAHGMRRFTEQYRYADGRQPSIGDSSRVGNPTNPPDEPLPPYAEPQFVVLDVAGYCFAKGNHEQRPFMFALNATSRTETHKHQDHLSFVLYFDGIEWLVDPSFHSYEPRQPVARYLRSAAAHNSVVLPGRAYDITRGLAQLAGTRSNDEFHVHGQHRAFSGALVERDVRGSLDCLRLDFCERVTFQDPTDAANPVLMLHCGDGVVATVKDELVTLAHPASTYGLVIRLPSSEITSRYGEVSEERVGGVTGFGFMEYGSSTSLECRLPRAEATWRLDGRRNLGN